MMSAVLLLCCTSNNRKNTTVSFSSKSADRWRERRRRKKQKQKQNKNNTPQKRRKKSYLKSHTLTHTQFVSMGLKMLVKQKADCYLVPSSGRARTHMHTHTHTHTHTHRGKICRKATKQQITACPVVLYKSSSLVLQPEAEQISFRVHIFSRPLQLYKKIIICVFLLYV